MWFMPPKPWIVCRTADGSTVTLGCAVAGAAIASTGSALIARNDLRLSDFAPAAVDSFRRRVIVFVPSQLAWFVVMHTIGTSRTRAAACMVEPVDLTRGA
ncbi:hypothetical protein GCM10028833_42930 [Glycomyces tarimensis]